MTVVLLVAAAGKPAAEQAQLVVASVADWPEWEHAEQSGKFVVGRQPEPELTAAAVELAVVACAAAAVLTFVEPVAVVKTAVVE